MKNLARPPVKTKHDFIQRYQLGEFGNRCPSWLSLTDLLASGYTQPVHIRNRKPGGPTWYNVPISTIEKAWCLASKVCGEKNLYLGAMGPPDKFRLFQGEVQQGVTNGLDLYYTTIAKPMREALNIQATSTNGIVAYCLLQNYLCPNSFSWLYTLLGRYPGHVVEFSTYRSNWGTLSNFNTVYWEVRQY